MGYSFFGGNSKVTVATDIGHIRENLIPELTGSDMVLLEANHDVEMLKAGPYPYPLKRRILGERGHLSNESAADLCVQLVKTGTRHILLGHLSQQNNLPELAYQTVKQILQENGITVDRDVTLSVASRHEHSALFAV